MIRLKIHIIRSLASGWAVHACVFLLDNGLGSTSLADTNRFSHSDTWDVTGGIAGIWYRLLLTLMSNGRGLFHLHLIYDHIICWLRARCATPLIWLLVPPQVVAFFLTAQSIMVSLDFCELLWIDFHRHMVFKASEMPTLCPIWVAAGTMWCLLSVILVRVYN